LDWDFADYERGARINNQLAAISEITKEDMQVLQLDNKSLHAEHVLPAMLGALKTEGLSEQQRQLVSTLDRWDYFKNGSLTAPTMFDRWWNKTYRGIWSDDLPSGAGFIWPSRTVTSEIIVEEPNSPWIDDVNTEETENLSDIVTKAFMDAVTELEESLGAPGKTWLWGNYQGAQIGHLGRIPGFSREVFTGGGHEAVNAIRGDHGPSWRMIVELAETTEALGIYPGGQSGNPGSPRYDNFVEDWAEGNIYTLQFSPRIGDMKSNHILVLK
jgi:penicillin amidase